MQKNNAQKTATNGVQTWATVVTGNKLASRGMTLSFIAPMIKEGEKIDLLEKEEIEKENDKWKSSIILYLIGNSLTIGAVERFLASQWNFAKKPQIYCHNEDYFVVGFDSLEERNEVLFSGPHTVNNRPAIVKTWSPEF